MKLMLRVSFSWVLFIFCTSLKAQETNNGQLRMTKEEILQSKAAGTGTPGSSNLSAVQEIVLFGDPSKPGLYTIVIKVAANTKIPAHLHPDAPDRLRYLRRVVFWIWR